MTDLIARIESADGPSYALDCAIGEYVAKATGRPYIIPPQPYSASIDAALTLVPEGWRPYSADMSIKGRTRFLIEGPKTEWSTDDEGEKCAGNDWYAQGVAATPALALAAAALKARGV